MTAGLFCAGAPDVLERLDAPTVRRPDFQERLHERWLLQRVVPMLGYALEAANIPVIDRITRLAEALTVYDRWQRDTLDTVLGRLQAAGVPVMLLKGAELQHRAYDESLPRGSKDLDLLVRPEHVDPTCAVLFELGFKHGYLGPRDGNFYRFNQEDIDKTRRRHHELASLARVEQFRPLQGWADIVPDIQAATGYNTVALNNGAVVGAINIDLHFNMLLDFDPDDVWAGATTWSCRGHEVWAADRATMFCLSATKYYHELFEQKARLRQFFDFIATLRHFHEAIDWQRVRDLMGRYAFGPAVFYMGTHANALLGVELVPREIIELGDPAHPEQRRRPHVEKHHHYGDVVAKMLQRGIVHTFEL